MSRRRSCCESSFGRMWELWLISPFVSVARLFASDRREMCAVRASCEGIFHPMSLLGFRSFKVEWIKLPTLNQAKPYTKAVRLCCERQFRRKLICSLVIYIGKETISELISVIIARLSKLPNTNRDVVIMEIMEMTRDWPDVKRRWKFVMGCTMITLSTVVDGNCGKWKQIFSQQEEILVFIGRGSWLFRREITLSKEKVMIFSSV